MPVSNSDSLALIVGASRGLGLGLAREYIGRGWQVIATLRGLNQDSALHDLKVDAGAMLEIEALDITIPDQITVLRQRLSGRSLDLLFVNAGVTNNPDETIADVSTKDFIHVMVTNALSPMRVIETFSDLVPSNGVIAVMSSALGSVGNNETGGWEVYRASKAALNTLMRSFAARHSGGARTLIIVSPGWVRTDMGGPDALLDVDTSVGGIVDMIAARQGTPGLAFLNYQSEVVSW